MNRYDDTQAQEDTLAEAVAAGNYTIDIARAGTVEMPPLPTDEPMVVCTLRLPPALYLRIKRVADESGVRPSALMRELLEAGLAEDEADEPVTVRPSELRRALASVLRHRAA